jgi:hypothetical protein
MAVVITLIVLLLLVLIVAGPLLEGILDRILPGSGDRPSGRTRR